MRLHEMAPGHCMSVFIRMHQFHNFSGTFETIIWRGLSRWQIWACCEGEGDYIDYDCDADRHVGSLEPVWRAVCTVLYTDLGQGY